MELDKMSLGMKEHFSKTKLNRQFRLGYKMAFEENAKRIDWNNIYAL